MSDAMRQLGVVSRRYEEMAVEYRPVAITAAEAEADYRRIKAVTMLKATADGASAAKAEIIADADDEVSAACFAYKTSAAIADAHRARLSQLREQVAVGRSVMVAEREADKLHAGGMSGAA